MRLSDYFNNNNNNKLCWWCVVQVTTIGTETFLARLAPQSYLARINFLRCIQTTVKSNCHPMTCTEGRHHAQGKTRYPLYTRLDGPRGRSRGARKISPPPGLDPRADNAIPGAMQIMVMTSFVLHCHLFTQTVLTYRNHVDAVKEACSVPSAS